MMTEAFLICPLVFLAGFVDAIAGGGGLISLPAYLLSGIPVHLAIGTNKFSACMGTAVATYRYAKEGFVPYRLALFGACFGLIGSVIGAKLALTLSADILKLFLLIILPLTAIYLLRTRKTEQDKIPYGKQKAKLFAAMIAFFIGIYDGFYGPGTGTFLILLLYGVAHIPLKETQGMTKVINLTTNAAALTGFLFHGQVWLALGLLAGAFSILGNYIGAKFFAGKGVQVTRPLILVVITIFFVRTLGEVLGIF